MFVLTALKKHTISSHGGESGERAWKEQCIDAMEGKRVDWGNYAIQTFRLKRKNRITRRPRKLVMYGTMEPINKRTKDGSPEDGSKQLHMRRKICAMLDGGTCGGD